MKLINDDERKRKRARFKVRKQIKLCKEVDFFRIAILIYILMLFEVFKKVFVMDFIAFLSSAYSKKAQSK